MGLLREDLPAAPKRVRCATGRDGVPPDAGAVHAHLGEFPGPPPEPVLAAARAALDDVHRYPDAQCEELREEIVRYVGCPGVGSDRVLVGNGSDELIDLVLSAVLRPGEEVLVPVPSFFVYGRSATIRHGVTRTIVRGEDFRVTAGQVLDALGPRTRVVFLASPNNPTGVPEAPDVLEEICRRAQCLVVLDECYVEFSGVTATHLLPRHGNLCILRSLSKTFGLAGLRVGYALGSPDLAAAMRSVQPVFSVNRVAQAAALAALRHRDLFAAQREELLRGRDRLVRALGVLGCAVTPSATNFLLVRVPAPPEACVAAELGRRGVHVADFTGAPGMPPGVTWLRIAACSADGNRATVAALETVLVRARAAHAAEKGT